MRTLLGVSQIAGSATPATRLPIVPLLALVSTPSPSMQPFQSGLFYRVPAELLAQRSQELEREWFHCARLQALL